MYMYATCIPAAFIKTLFLEQSKGMTYVAYTRTFPTLLFASFILLPSLLTYSISFIVVHM